MKELKHEWRWLPTRRESGAYVALLMAIVFSSLSVSRVAITTPEGFNKQLTWNAIDELFVLVLLGASVFAIYTMYRLFQAEAAAGRPAIARLQMGVGSLLVLLLTLSVARPLFISEILIHTATPRYENVTPEEVWEGHEEDPLSRELYIVVCQAIVDRDYEMGRPLRQCVDPGGSGALLSLEPSEQAKEFRTVYRNLYHMRHAGIRLLSYWLVGLVIIAIVLGAGRRKKVHVLQGKLQFLLITALFLGCFVPGAEACDEPGIPEGWRLLNDKELAVESEIRELRYERTKLF